MPEEFAPPVVAVVASADPGSWFEECLASLGAQDYPNLDVLVVDDASATDLTTRVAGVLPGAYVRALELKGGLSAAFDEALTGVDGASFFLFCHDDVALDPDTVRELVSESFRSNAAVVGPKLVDWESPERLLQIGLNVTRRGHALPRVEEGELDQAQHDEVREVFSTPGGCMLVRSDLFTVLGGFDRELDGYGEDVDLCWRAQIAGARVAVAPAARVRHLQATARGERGRLDAVALRRRHELRTLLKNRSVAFLPAAVLLEAAGSIGRWLLRLAPTGRRPELGPSQAWRWNLARRRSLVEDRRLLRQLRQVSDRELARRMSRTGRLTLLLRRGAPGDQTQSSSSPASRPPLHPELERLSSWVVRTRSGEVSIGPVVAGAVVALLLLAGLRGVLFGPLPVVGSLVPLPPAGTMLGQYFAGRPDPGWAAAPGVTPPGYLVIGLLGVVLGNSSALALKALLVSGVTVGALGASRLVRPWSNPRGRVVAAAAYVASPLQWNAIARGDVGGAVVLAGLPFLLGRLAQSTGASGGAKADWRLRALVSEMSGFALILAAVASLAPAIFLDVGVAWAAIALASFVAGRSSRAALTGSARSALVLAGGGGGAILLTMPWSGTWLAHGADWSLLTGALGATGSVGGPAAFLAGHLGPFGGWWGSLGLLAAGVCALLVGSGGLLEWATRWWVVALSGAGFAWACARGALGPGLGNSIVLAAPVAAGVAASIGLTVASFEKDLRRHGVGWRHVAAALSSAALVLGLLPAFGSLLDGRSQLPSAGFGQFLSWTASSAGAPHGARTLWLGDPAALPGASLELSPGLAVFSSPSGTPAAEQLLPSTPEPSLLAVRDDLRRAEAGTTVRLGALLAPEGIRYLVVPSAEAPVTAGGPVRATYVPPPALVSALEAQSDLRQRLTEAGVLVFQNSAWHPADGAGSASAGRGPGTVGSSAPMARRGSRTGGIRREVGLALAMATLLLVVGELATRRRRRNRAPRHQHVTARAAAT